MTTRPILGATLLALSLALAPASAQDAAPEAAAAAPAAPATTATVSKQDAAALAQVALDHAGAYRTLVSTLTAEAILDDMGEAATEDATAARAAANAALVATRDFAVERANVAEALVDLLAKRPGPDPAIDFIQAREDLQSRRDRRAEEAKLAEAQAKLDAGTPREALTRVRAAFQAEVVSSLDAGLTEMNQAWEQAYPDADARQKAETAALETLREQKAAEQAAAREAAQKQAAELEEKQAEQEALAARAREELEAAKTEDEAQLAELRLEYANLGKDVNQYELKASQAEADAHEAETQLTDLKATMPQRIQALLKLEEGAAKVREYREELQGQLPELTQRLDLLQKEIELLRQKVPTIRAKSRELRDLYDELDEGMRAKRGDQQYRQRVYFARLATRRAAQKLDEYRTFVEWKERLLVTMIQRRDVLEDGIGQLEKRAERRILGQTRDQWRRFLLFLAGTFLVSMIVNLLAKTIFKTFSDRTAWTWDDIALEELSTPVFLLVFLAGLQFALQILTIPPRLESPFTSWAAAIRAVWIGFLAWRITNIICRVIEPSIEKSEAKLDDQLYRFIQRGVRVTIVAVTIVFFLEAFGWKVTSLLAGLGIGGLAFALAAKDTLANLFGSIVLFMDRPFRVGNWVIISGTEGVVEDIGIRSTRIRTFKDTVVTIPNATVANASAENVHSFRKRRLYFTMELRFDTPTKTVREAVKRMRQILKEHPMVLDGIMTYCFVGTRDWGEWLVHCQDVYLEVLDMLEEIGAGLAFPTQTIEFEHVKGLPGAEQPGAGVPGADLPPEAAAKS
jgi:MscS family membrane protein